MVTVTISLQRKVSTIEETYVCSFNSIKEVKTFVNRTSSRLGRSDKTGYIKFNLLEGSLLILPISEVSIIKINADEEQGINYLAISAAK